MRRFASLLAVGASLVGTLGCQILSGVNAYEPAGSGGAGANGGGSGGDPVGVGGNGANGGTGGVDPDDGLFGVWHEPRSAPQQSTMKDMVTMPNGDVIVAGEGAPELFGQQTSSNAGFVARLTRAGDTQWIQSINAANPGSFSMRAVAATNDRVVVVGQFDGNLSFPEANGMGGVNLTSMAPSAFIVAIRSDGVPLWGVRSVVNSAQLLDVAVDGTRIVAVGQADGPTNFVGSGVPLCSDLSAPAAQDALIVDLRLDGTCNGLDRLDDDCDGATVGTESAEAVELAHGAIYFAGNFDNNVMLNACVKAEGVQAGFVGIGMPQDGQAPRLDGQRVVRSSGPVSITALEPWDTGIGVIGHFAGTLANQASVGTRDVFVQLFDAGLTLTGEITLGTPGEELVAGGLGISPPFAMIATGCDGSLDVGVGFSLDGPGSDICLGFWEFETGPTPEPLGGARFGDDDALQGVRAVAFDGAGIVLAGDNEGSLTFHPLEPQRDPNDAFVAALAFPPGD